jgi:hypothetical protein
MPYTGVDPWLVVEGDSITAQAAVGAIKSSTTTPLMRGAQGIEIAKKTEKISNTYQPAK